MRLCSGKQPRDVLAHLGHACAFHGESILVEPRCLGQSQQLTPQVAEGHLTATLSRPILLRIGRLEWLPTSAGSV